MKKLWHLSEYCALAFLLMWIIGFIVFCLYALSFKYSEALSTNAIVVLTGGMDRIKTGIDLMPDHPNAKLLISGVNKEVKPENILRQIPPELQLKTTLGYQATDTQGNALEVNDFITKNNIKSILLVTSFYHMPRSIFEITMQNETVDIYPYPVFPQSFNNSVDWLKTRYAWLLFIEYHKFIFVHTFNFLRKAF